MQNTPIYRVTCTSFTHYQKNTLRGFANILIEPPGLELRDCPCHTKDGQQWVSPPARPFTTPDGTQGYSAMATFPDKRKRYTWSDAAVAAVRDYVKKNPQGGEPHGS